MQGYSAGPQNNMHFKWVKNTFKKSLDTKAIDLEDCYLLTLF